MIDLMLHDTRSEILESESIFFPFCIEKIHSYPCPALYCACFSWYRETPLFITASFATFFDDFRIDHGNSPKVFIFVVLHKRYYNKTLIYSYLRRSESDSTIFGVFDMLYHFFGKRSIIFEFMIFYRV